MNTLAVQPAETEQSLDLREVLAAARRRRHLIILALAVGLTITLLLTVLLPPRFRSTGTILIEQQEVPVDLVRSTVTSYADQRVQMISQRVMTTQTLLGIMRRYDLYPGEEQRLAREELIEKMRADVALNMISADVIDPRSGMPRKGNIAFSLSFTSRSADKAMRVANELSTLFLNENLTSRARLADDAASFLKAEGDQISGRIAELEAKLAKFKERNVDSLPELASMNMQLLDRTEQELRQLETRQSGLQQQKVFLEAQLATIKPNSALMSDSGERIMSPADRLKAARSELASVRAIYASGHPDIARLEREVAGLEQDGAVVAVDTNDLLRRLDGAQGKLADARVAYAAGHPDIARLEREVSGLEAELAQQARTPAAPVKAADPDNPAYIQLRAQLEATLVDLRGVDTIAAQLRSQLAGYQRNVNVSPQTEREYRELTRDYDNARIQYQQSRAKQMEAQAAQNLEADRKSERFTMIEPPLLPTKPVSPNRVLVLTLGVLFSIALAAALAAIAEKLDGTVRGHGDMARVFGAAPLALIPRIRTALDARIARRRRWYAFGGSVATILCSLLALHLLYRPLDMLWFTVLRRLGI